MSGDGETRRVALVTGCGKPDGIGRASAVRLHALGVEVVLSDLPGGPARARTEDATAGPPDEDLERFAERLSRSGPRAWVAPGDVSTESGAAAIVAEAIRQAGRLDVLVNNAAAPHGAELTDVADVPAEAWDTVIAVNLRGAFLMCRAAIPEMRRRQWGRIVNISSIAGRTGLPRRAAYSASKAGILGLTRSIAADAAPFGITVNALCPGPIETSRTGSSARLEAADEAAERARRLARVPVGRMGTPDDVAAAVAFFASEESGFVTGQTLNVDGGMVMA